MRGKRHWSERAPNAVRPIFALTVSWRANSPPLSIARQAIWHCQICREEGVIVRNASRGRPPSSSTMVAAVAGASLL